MSTYIAIDLDSQGLCAVVGASRGPARLTHALTWTADDADPPPALAADTAEALGKKLRDKLRGAGAPPAPVLVAVGRERVILKELKYPPVPPTEEPALVRFQAMKEMSESPEDVVLDYAPLGEVGGERRSMAVVLRKETFQAIQAMCSAANLKLVGVTPRPYAIAAGLTRAFAAGTAPAPDDKNDAVAALTVGPAGGEFTVVRRGEVTFTLAIPAPVVASETLLVAQIRRNLTMYAGQHPGHPIQAVYIAEVGGTWAPRLRAALGIPVHSFDPLADALPSVADPLRGRFAGAVGLLAGRGANTLPINFVAPRQPQAQKDPAKRKLALVALAALLLLVIGGEGGYWMVNAGEDNIRSLTKQRDDLKELLAKGGPDVTRVKGIDGWTKREVVWLDELYDLADRMPQDDSVRVHSLTATPMPVGKDGKQDGQAKLELKLAATSVTAAGVLENGFVRDNSAPNKYYIGALHSVGPPLGPSAGKHNQSVTFTTRVNRREPVEYERNTRVPGKRTSGGAGGSTAVAIAPIETAPAPSEPPAP